MNKRLAKKIADLRVIISHLRRERRKLQAQIQIMTKKQMA